MRTFLAWRCKGGAPSPSAEAVVERLAAVFAPALDGEVGQTVRAGPHATVVGIHLPVLNWLPPYAEEDAGSWVEAIDYPLDAHTLQQERGAAYAMGSTLLPLARALVAAPRAWLSELAPPFSLISSDARSGATWIHNDALGQAQLFVYEDDGIWALTNRVFALRALGIRLEADPLEWACRAAMGWFPLTMTGYRGVRLLEGGTAIRLDASGIHEDRSDVLGSWVSSMDMEGPERLELAHRSLDRQVRGLQSQWRRPCAGLSGGWDSRVVVSALLAAGTDFRARVKGAHDAQDVRLAKELAAVAGLDLTHTPKAELPGQGAADARRSIRTALIWGAGHSDTTKHKSEFARGQRIQAKELNIMGQHGELARGSYYGPAMDQLQGNRTPMPGHRIAELYVPVLFELRPPGIRPELLEPVRAVIAEALNQAAPYEIPGFGWMDFFYLYECTRRRSAGSLAAQGSLVVAPFLNADFVRACFGGSTLPLHEDPIHRHIIDRNMPDWTAVPFTRKGDNVRKESVEARALSTEETDFYHLHGSLYYDALEFWGRQGAPLLEEVQDAEGLWTEVFEVEPMRADPRAAADELTMLLELDHLLSATQQP